MRQTRQRRAQGKRVERGMKAKSALCWNMLAAVIECFTISTPVGSLTTQLMMTKNCADALHGYRSLEMRMLPHMLSIRFRSLPGLRPKMAGLWIRNPESSKTPETSGGPSFGLLHIGKARQLRRNTHRSACSRRSQMGGQDGSHKPNPCCRKASNCECVTAFVSQASSRRSKSA